MKTKSSRYEKSRKPTFKISLLVRKWRVYSFFIQKLIDCATAGGEFFNGNNKKNALKIVLKVGCSQNWKTCLLSTKNNQRWKSRFGQKIVKIIVLKCLLEPPKIIFFSGYTRKIRKWDLFSLVSHNLKASLWRKKIVEN